MYIRDDKIAELMAKSHAELDRLINQVVEGVNVDAAERKALFEEFKDKLIKHMKIEEDSVFGLKELQGGAVVDTIWKLLKDHLAIAEQVAEIESDIMSGQDVRLSELAQLMYNHQVLENTSLYPYLDKNLPPMERENVLKKISILV
ncbi:MAG: hemerythrin domain-containing protein [Candidatus Falkowbacteria bacterium]